jgi:hypothetical protein
MPTAEFPERRFSASPPGFDSPHDAVQENGTYGGQGKAVGCVPPTALLFLSGRRNCARQDLGAATSKTFGFAPLRNPHVTHTALKCLQFRQTANLWN